MRGGFRQFVIQKSVFLKHPNQHSVHQLVIWFLLLSVTKMTFGCFCQILKMIEKWSCMKHTELFCLP